MNKELIERLEKDRQSLRGVASGVYVDDLADAIAEIKRLSCEGERYRAALEKIVKGPREGWNLLNLADMLDWANKALVSEELPPDTCPECHGTGKTVIRKEFGVEDCPECAM